MLAAYLIRRRLQGAPIPVIDTRTPWEIAIDELDRIERLDLPEDGRFKEHYTLVADAMRVYVQAMYLRDVSPVDAIDMTTDEIRTALRRSSLNYDDAKLVLDLLQEADLVKFAKYTPAVSQSYEASGQARYIVEVTRPAFQPGRAVAERDIRPAGGPRVNDLSFGSPWLLPPLAGVALLAALPYLWKRRMSPVGMRYADTGLVSGTGSSVRLRVMPFVSGLRFVALALVIVAVARPQSADAREVIRGEGVDIAIALDISGSMGQQDFDPHRLDAAKEIIADFIVERKYDRIGLVVFSRDAFVQSPPTLDHDVLLRLLDEVDLADRLRIQDGTAIGSGMATAANMLKDSTVENKLVTLLTDGVNNAGDLDPVTVATAAEALEIKVYNHRSGQTEPFRRRPSTWPLRRRRRQAAKLSRRGDAPADRGDHEREVLPRDGHGGAAGHLRGDQRPGEVGDRGAPLHHLSRACGVVPGPGPSTVPAGTAALSNRIQKDTVR